MFVQNRKNVEFYVMKTEKSIKMIAPFFFLLHTRNISPSFHLIFSFFFLNLAGYIFVSEDEARSAIIYIFSIKKISTK